MCRKWIVYLMTGCLLLMAMAGCQTTTAGQTGAAAGPFPKEGFVTFDEDGRIWVFQSGAKELADYKEKGELAKFVVRPGAGPERRTLKAPDSETIILYMTQTPGFTAYVEDGRLWVFRDGAKELADYKEKGELAKFVVRPNAGPMGITLRAPDAETLDAYQSAQ